MRVLIVKTSSMGDVIHALPVVSDIARALPHARIDWVVEESFADIVRLHRRVLRIHTVALRRWKRHPFARGSWAELLAARESIRRVRYHDVIDCQGLLKSALVARWARGPVTGFATGSAREPLASLLYQRRIEIDRGLHAIERSRLLVGAALGYTPEGEARFGLRVPGVGPASEGMPGDPFAAEPAPVPQDEPAASAMGDARAGGYALLLTNASRLTKLWPSSHWRALEAHLAAQGLRSLLPWGSEAEGRATRERASGMRDARVLAPMSLSALARLAAGARVVVGLDTGLTHLSAALGTPTLGLFCDYDPALVGLRGDGGVRSLGGIEGGPEAAEAIEALQSLLDHGKGN